MPNFIRPALVGLFLWWGSSAASSSPDISTFSHDEALAYSQAVIGESLHDIQLTREDGTTVKVEDYRGKPLVISLIFTSCHHICPTTTVNLDEVVQKARDALDADSFHVISVGFDTANDTPARMAQFRASSGIDDERWDFLSGDAANMEKLVDQLGFLYSPSPRGFDHLIQSSVIDSQGKVYRQLYGISFPTTHLIEPLKELVFGGVSSTSALDYLEDRIRLFCTVYDPATDTYRIDISVFIGTIVGLIVSIVFGSLLIKEWRRSIEAEK
jgi:protein SCO1/2